MNTFFLKSGTKQPIQELRGSTRTNKQTIPAFATTVFYIREQLRGQKFCILLALCCGCYKVALMEGQLCVVDMLHEYK